LRIANCELRKRLQPLPFAFCLLPFLPYLLSAICYLQTFYGDNIMFRQLSLPLKIALGFAALGLALTVVGIMRGNVPLNPASIAMALLIGGGSWFLVSWAVAAAAVDVEEDVAEAQSRAGSDERG
jgi:hypothetical protein